jgi:hypothetical protein
MVNNYYQNLISVIVLPPQHNQFCNQTDFSREIGSDFGIDCATVAEQLPKSDFGNNYSL